TRWLAASRVAAVAVRVVAAPSRLARGEGKGGQKPDDGTSNPTGTDSVPTGWNNNSNGTVPGKTIEGKDIPRDGEEQTGIAKDVLDGLGSSEFARLRALRNRQTAEPRRDGTGDR